MAITTKMDQILVDAYLHAKEINHPALAKFIREVVMGEVSRNYRVKYILTFNADTGELLSVTPSSDFKPPKNTLGILYWMNFRLAPGEITEVKEQISRNPEDWQLKLSGSTAPQKVIDAREAKKEKLI